MQTICLVGILTLDRVESIINNLLFEVQELEFQISNIEIGSSNERLSE